MWQVCAFQIQRLFKIRAGPGGFSTLKGPSSFLPTSRGRNLSSHFNTLTTELSNLQTYECLTSRESYEPQLNGDSIRFARTEAETGTAALSKLLRFFRWLLSVSVVLEQ